MKIKTENEKEFLSWFPEIEMLFKHFKIKDILIELEKNEHCDMFEYKKEIEKT